MRSSIVCFGLLHGAFSWVKGARRRMAVEVLGALVQRFADQLGEQLLGSPESPGPVGLAVERNSCRGVVIKRMAGYVSVEVAVVRDHGAT
jgi:hypothetical protein